MREATCMTTNPPSNKDYQEKNTIYIFLEMASQKTCIEGQAAVKAALEGPGIAQPKISGSTVCEIIYW